MPLISSLGTMNAIGLKKSSNGTVLTPSTAVAYSGTFQNFNAYPWSTSGFGTRFSAPSTVIPDAGYQCSFNPAKTALGVAHSIAPFVAVYAFSATTGFGTQYANPSTLPAAATSARGFAFSNNGTAVAVGSDSSPYIQVYPWSNGFGTKIADPATLPTGLITSIKFNSSSTLIAMASSTGTKALVYPWSNGFGTKFADPASYPGGSTYGADICFNPASTLLALAVGTATSTNLISVYDWSDGYGTRYTNPAVTGASNCIGLTFSKSGSALLFSTNANATVPSPNPNVLIAYSWSGNFGTKYAAMLDPPTATSYGKVNMESSGKYVGMAFNGASGSPPYSAAIAYGWDDTTGFGSQYRAPSGSGAGSGITFN